MGSNWHTVSRDRYSIVYDSRDNVTSESASQRKVSGGGVGTITTYVTNTVNYYTNGLLTFTSNDEWKNGYDEGTNGTPDTSMSYTYDDWDDARIATTSLDNNPHKQQPTSSRPIISIGGPVAAVDINDGRRRTVCFAYAPEGQVLNRKERSAASANPEDQRYFISGHADRRDHQQWLLRSGSAVITPRPDPAQLENNMTAGPFRWNSPSPTLRGNFGVTGGYRLYQPHRRRLALGLQPLRRRRRRIAESIAASAWGDASLWYMIAQANGLGAGATLIAGQSLIVPDRVNSIHNNNSTFEIYDPNKAMGDLAPTTAKPPKIGGCGVIGQILTVAISVVFGNIGGQLFSMAIGQQDKFNWKSLAIAAVSAVVTAGFAAAATALAEATATTAASISQAANFVANSASVGAQVLRGVVANVATQGIATATGLQKHFSWTGVAVAGVTAGVSGFASKILPGHATIHSGPSAGNSLASGAIALAAGAGARSLATGTDFGDNIMAVLPDVIGQTVGNMLNFGVEGAFSQREAGGDLITGAGAYGSDTAPGAGLSSASMTITQAGTSGASAENSGPSDLIYRRDDKGDALVVSGGRSLDLGISAMYGLEPSRPEPLRNTLLAMIETAQSGASNPTSRSGHRVGQTLSFEGRKIPGDPNKKITSFFLGSDNNEYSDSQRLDMAAENWVNNRAGSEYSMSRRMIQETGSNYQQLERATIWLETRLALHDQFSDALGPDVAILRAEVDRRNAVASAAEWQEAGDFTHAYLNSARNFSVGIDVAMSGYEVATGQTSVEDVVRGYVYAKIGGHLLSALGTGAVRLYSRVSHTAGTAERDLISLASHSERSTASEIAEEAAEIGGDSQRVLFGQRRMSPNFGTEGRPSHLAGRPVSDVADDLRNRRLHPDDLPIEAFYSGDNLVSINTRSLGALSEAGIRPTIIHIVDDPGRDVLRRLTQDPLIPAGALPGPRIPVTPSRSDHTIMRIIELPWGE